jgi:hypothetical protein
LGIVTTTSETAFTQSAETVYDFVTNPQNWTKTYPGSAHIGKLPPLPLKVGDTWEEADPDGNRAQTRPAARSALRAGNPARIDAYHKAVARELGQIDTSAGVA